MKYLPTLAGLAVLGALVSLSAYAVEEGGLIDSMRGDQALQETNKAPQLKQWQRDRPPIPRDYVQQPPLVPHSIDRYRITKDNNKCMTCHSWTRYKESGATKVSLTHFKNREGTDLANVAPRRYFCNQCHVPQVDAKPLVDNQFVPIKAVSQKK